MNPLKSLLNWPKPTPDIITISVPDNDPAPEFEPLSGVEGRAEVLRRLCRLATKVRDEIGGGCADCFCGSPREVDILDRYYAFDARVLDFIERAVQRAIDDPGHQDGREVEP